jgi:CheY-like chemotaxis protein
MKGILLIEDSDQDAESVEHAFRLFGIVNPVLRLRDGVEALEYLVQAEKVAAVGPPVPSVLLLDLRLPGVTGFEILDFLQNRPAFAATLKIVLSQVEDLHSIKRAYALGAQSFLCKPIHQSDLNNLIISFPTHWLLMKGSPQDVESSFRNDPGSLN